MKYLKVSEIHTIHYEVCGNPDAEAILFVHGGPGAGFSEQDKRFFNFEKQKVIFFDQRGSAKSIPFGSIVQNTTQDLIDDINKLLDFLNIDKIALFGGSWGTTLSLAYAVQNPDRVKKLLLRGIFLGNKESIDYYLNGGIQEKFPKIWKRFRENAPTDFEGSIAEYYLKKMVNGSKEEKKYFSYEWAFYEISIFKKDILNKEVESILKNMPYESLSILEAHYLTNNCFLDENYILKNVEKINHIPIKIIHGKQDAICPLKFAVQLHSTLVNSDLFIVEAGHSDSEPEIEKKIMEIIKTF